MKAHPGTLALINWLSAPFGTAEYILKNFGVEGKDFTLDADGNPILNEVRPQERPRSRERPEHHVQPRSASISTRAPRRHEVHQRDGEKAARIRLAQPHQRHVL